MTPAPFGGALDSARDTARRRSHQGLRDKEHPNKLAPCAPALFISPSAKLRARVPPASPDFNPSSGSMEMRASFSNPPRLQSRRAALSDQTDND